MLVRVSISYRRFPKLPSCACCHQKVHSDSYSEYWLQSILSPHSLTKIAAKRSEHRLCANLTECALCIYRHKWLYFLFPARKRQMVELVLRDHTETLLSLLFVPLVFKGWVAISQWWSHAECTEGLLVAAVAPPVLHRSLSNISIIYGGQHSLSQTQTNI